MKHNLHRSLILIMAMFASSVVFGQANFAFTNTPAEFQPEGALKAGDEIVFVLSNFPAEANNAINLRFYPYPDNEIVAATQPSNISWTSSSDRMNMTLGLINDADVANDNYTTVTVDNMDGTLTKTYTIKDVSLNFEGAETFKNGGVEDGGNYAPIVRLVHANGQPRLNNEGEVGSGNGNNPLIMDQASLDQSPDIVATHLVFSYYPPEENETTGGGEYPHITANSALDLTADPSEASFAFTNTPAEFHPEGALAEDDPISFVLSNFPAEANNAINLRFYPYPDNEVVEATQPDNISWTSGSDRMNMTLGLINDADVDNDNYTTVTVDNMDGTVTKTYTIKDVSLNFAGAETFKNGGVEDGGNYAPIVRLVHANGQPRLNGEGEVGMGNGNNPLIVDQATLDQSPDIVATHLVFSYYPPEENASTGGGEYPHITANASLFASADEANFTFTNTPEKFHPDGALAPEDPISFVLSNFPAEANNAINLRFYPYPDNEVVEATQPNNISWTSGSDRMNMTLGLINDADVDNDNYTTVTVDNMDGTLTKTYTIKDVSLNFAGAETFKNGGVEHDGNYAPIVRLVHANGQPRLNGEGEGGMGNGNNPLIMDQASLDQSPDIVATHLVFSYYPPEENATTGGGEYPHITADSTLFDSMEAEGANFAFTNTPEEFHPEGALAADDPISFVLSNFPAEANNAINLRFYPYPDNEVVVATQPGNISWTSSSDKMNMTLGLINDADVDNDNYTTVTVDNMDGTLTKTYTIKDVSLNFEGAETFKNGGVEDGGNYAPIVRLVHANGQPRFNNEGELGMGNGNNPLIMDQASLDQSPDIVATHLVFSYYPPEENATTGGGEYPHITANAALVTSSVNDVADISSSVFPNPVNSILYVGSEIETSTYRIVNMMGALVKEVNAKGSINVSDLTPGMYILTTEAGNAMFVKN